MLLPAYELHETGSGYGLDFMKGRIFDEKHTAAQRKLALLVACDNNGAAAVAVFKKIAAYLGFAYNV